MKRLAQRSLRWDRGNLLRHSLVLLAATQAANLCSLLFQVVMMRALAPEEYGFLAAMLSLTLIVTMPSEALRTAVAHATATLAREGRLDELRATARSWIRNVAAAALLLVVVMAAGSGPMASFMRVSRAGPIVGMAVGMGALVFLNLFMGMAQGRQCFVRLAVIGQGWALLRLVAGAALVWYVAPTAGWAVAAQAAALGCGALVGWLLCYRPLPAGPPRAAPAGQLGYFTKSLLILASLAVLMYGDIALAKHYFAPLEAGVFARAAVIGRALVFLPMPVAFALFPKVVASGGGLAESRRMLGAAMLLVVGLVAAAAAAAALLYPWIWRGFTGVWPRPAELALGRCMLVAMGSVAPAYLLVNFELARRRFRAGWIVLAGSAGYVVSAALYHPTPRAIVWALAAAAAATSGALLAHALRARSAPEGTR